MGKKRYKSKSNKKMFKQNKIKVLAYCDSPSCATGFGTVSRNIFEGLQKTGRYEIDILGINYWGDPHPYPYRIWPTGTNGERDPYGRKKICGMVPRMQYDLLFFLQDTFILDFLPELTNYLHGQGKKFKSICYFPVDGTPKEKWIKNVTCTDYPVAYCEYGKKEAEAVYKDCPDLKVIPHGANTKDFFIIGDKEKEGFRKQYFQHHWDKFIFTNLNRNQQRKDIPRTIRAFAEFREQVPNSILYLHMAKQDQGWNLEEVCKSYGFNTSDDVIFPENFGPNQGYPREIVNMIYNASDCVLSTALGEGWGLSWVEAMATKTPIIMPRNTALIENVTEDRGYLVDSGTSSGLYTVLPHDNEVIRPLVDVDDMVKTMLHVYNNYDEAKEKAENAFNWINEKLEWQKRIVPSWVALFDEAYQALQREKLETVDTTTEKIIAAEAF